MKWIDIPETDGLLHADLVNSFAELIRRGDFILGEEVEKLENDLASYLGVRHAIALSSGTDALLLALRSLDLEAGSEVITTPFTFFATSESIINAGLKPVFVDIDLQSYNLDPKKIEESITPRTRAILPVHIFGQPARMAEIKKIATHHGLKVVEDCAQAFGAKIDDAYVGTFGDVGAFSFYPTKNLGAYGDAGMAVTDDGNLAAKILLLRNQGSGIPYRHTEVGCNSRCDTLQAMILRKKLPFTEALNERRKKIAEIYKRDLGQIPGLLLPCPAADEHHVYHQYTVQTEDRNRLQKDLNTHQIPSAIYYDLPLHRQEAILKAGIKTRDLPETDRAAARVLSLPVAPHLNNQEVDFVISVIRNHFSYV